MVYFEHNMFVFIVILYRYHVLCNFYRANNKQFMVYNLAMHKMLIGARFSFRSIYDVVRFHRNILDKTADRRLRVICGSLNFMGFHFNSQKSSGINTVLIEYGR